MSKIRKVETDMELLEKVLSKENLNNAYRQVYKNKGASGVDGVTVYEEEFSNNSYGFRPNHSCEMAVIKALECFNDEYDWIVDIDL